MKRELTGSDEEIAARALEVYRTATDKTYRKAAGAALHRLRSRGLSIPELPLQGGSVRREVEREPAKSYVTMPDTFGCRYVWLEYLEPQAMRPAFWGIVGERTGIEGFDWTQRVSTKKRREHLAKLSLQEVPREYAQHLFEMAARDVDPRIGAVPKEYEEVARRMGPAAGWTPDLHQAWALLGMDPRLQALAPPWFGLFRQGLALWHLPEVRAWRLYPDEGRRIRAFARTTSLGASMRSCSRIYFSQRVRRERWALRLLDLVVRLKQQAAELGGPLPKQIEVLPSVAGTLAAHLLREHSDPALNPFAAGLMFRTVQAKKPARRQEPLTAEPAEAQPQDQAQPPSLEQETHEPSDLSL